VDEPTASTGVGFETNLVRVLDAKDALCVVLEPAFSVRLQSARTVRFAYVGAVERGDRLRRELAVVFRQLGTRTSGSTRHSLLRSTSSWFVERTRLGRPVNVLGVLVDRRVGEPAGKRALDVLARAEANISVVDRPELKTGHLLELGDDIGLNVRVTREVAFRN
jgi:hypothetical protein